MAGVGAEDDDDDLESTGAGVSPAALSPTHSPADSPVGSPTFERRFLREGGTDEAAAMWGALGSNPRLLADASCCLLVLLAPRCSDLLMQRWWQSLMLSVGELTC